MPISKIPAPWARSLPFLGSLVAVALPAATLAGQAANPLFARAKLLASGGGPHDIFGSAVAMSGDTVVVGAPQFDFFQSGPGNGHGRVYVLEKPATGWTNATQRAVLTPSDGGPGDVFGSSVAMFGDTVVVGAPQWGKWKTPIGPGKAYVFEKPATGWRDMTETAVLTASSRGPADCFGTAVTMHGDTVVVGAFEWWNGGPHGTGKAYVFEKPGAGWQSMTESAVLTASDGAVGDGFGASAAISGDTIVVGSPEWGTTTLAGPGKAYVFSRPGGGWTNATETAILTPSDGVVGDIFADNDGVAIDGATVVVGAWGRTTAGNAYQGAAYVFVEPPGGWQDATETAVLTASDGETGDALGDVVRVRGDTVAVQALGDDLGTGPYQGSVYLYVEPATGWSSTTETTKLLSSDGVTRDYFGSGMALGDSTLVIGASRADIGGNKNQGAAYVYRFDLSSYGTGTPGTAGLVPALTGTGAPTPGGRFSLQLDNGLAGAPGGLLIGFDRAALPFLGGTVLVQPALALPLRLDGTGRATLPLQIPASSTAGTRLDLQAGFLDAAAPAGLSMTNGFEMWIL